MELTDLGRLRSISSDDSEEGRKEVTLVQVEDLQEDLPLDLTTLPSLVEAALEEMKGRAEEVSILFVGVDEICRLHQDLFGDSSPTDCISIPCDQEEGGEYRVLGDVVVCPRTAMIYGEENGIDPYREVTLYLIHGLLHLLGYDDIEDDNRKEMRMAEERIMKRLDRDHLVLRNL